MRWSSAPITPLRSLDVLPKAERHQLLVEWNDTAADYPARPVHPPAVRGSRSARTPEAVAVVYEEQQLTYRRAQRAGQPAGASSAPLGVGPDVLVGLCVERSLEMVVALLGHPEGRRRLRAAGPGLSGGAAGVHAGGRPGAGAPDAGAAAAISCRRTRARTLCLDRGLADHDARRSRRPNPDLPATTAEQPRLRHLHLGLDRHAQGRDDRAPALVNHCWLDASTFQLDRNDSRLAEDAVQLRRSVWEFFSPLLAGCVGS